MRKSTHGLLVVLAIILSAGFVGYAVSYWSSDQPSILVSEPPTTTGEPYVDDIRHMRWLLDENWSWREMRAEQGVDLDALEAEALSMVASDPSDRGFLRAITRFTAGLRDGHASTRLSGVDPKEELRWPFTLIEVREGLMIGGIDTGIFMSKAVDKGDLVLEVNGSPIEELIREQERFVMSSTPRARRTQALFKLGSSTAKDTLQVRVLRLGSTEPETIEIPCAQQSSPVPNWFWRPFKEKYEDLDDVTAYFCPGDFLARDPAWATTAPDDRDQLLDSRYEQYATNFELIATKSKLILDLRGNPGGTDLLGQALALHLLEPGFRYYGLASKRLGEWRRTSWTKPECGRGTPRFSGRVVCLINEETFSTADNLATCLRDEHPNVTFIGQPTGGGSGAPRWFTLPSTQASIRFCTMQVYAPNGTFIEGNGVEPDIEVLRTREQVLAGTDVALQIAMEE